MLLAIVSLGPALCVFWVGTVSGRDPAKTHRDPAKTHREPAKTHREPVQNKQRACPRHTKSPSMAKLVLYVGYLAS